MKFFTLFLIFSFAPLTSSAQLLVTEQKIQSVKPWIGIGIDENPKGVLINNVYAGTPGFKAGLKKGDIVITIDDKKVSTPKELVSIVQAKGVGHKVNLKCLGTDGKERLVTLSLEAMPGITEIAEKNLIDKVAPDFKAKVLSVHKKKEKEFQLSKHKNKVKVIEFWATWCSNCVVAHPVVKKYAEENPNIEVIAYSDEEIPVLKKFLDLAKKKKITSDNVIFLQGTDSKITADYFVTAYPMFFVIDKKGKVQMIKIGGGANVDTVFAKAIELVSK